MTWTDRYNSMFPGSAHPSYPGENNNIQLIALVGIVAAIAILGGILSATVTAKVG